MKTRIATILILYMAVTFPFSAAKGQIVICGDTLNPNYVNLFDSIVIDDNSYDVKFDLTGDFVPDLYFDVDVTSTGGNLSTINVTFQVFVTNPNFEMMMDASANPEFDPYYVHGFLEGDTLNYASETSSWEQDTDGDLVHIYYGYGGVGGGGAWANDSLLYLGFRYIGISDTTYGWFKLRSDIGYNILSIVSASVLDINDFNIIPWIFEKDNGIKFFPNPAKNEIMPVVSFSGHVYLFDYNGVLKYESTYKQNELIPLPSYINDGLYLIKFFGDNKETQSDYIIIDRDN